MSEQSFPDRSKCCFEDPDIGHVWFLLGLGLNARQSTFLGMKDTDSGILQLLSYLAALLCHYKFNKPKCMGIFWLALMLNNVCQYFVRLPCPCTIFYDVLSSPSCLVWVTVMKIRTIVGSVSSVVDMDVRYKNIL
jgi:hypothetical protein